MKSPSTRVLSIIAIIGVIVLGLYLMQAQLQGGSAASAAAFNYMHQGTSTAQTAAKESATERASQQGGGGGGAGGGASGGGFTFWGWIVSIFHS